MRALAAGVSLSLELNGENGGLTALLLRLRGVPLRALMRIAAFEFSRVDEVLLAGYSIQETLTMRLGDPDRRLARVPPGCQVEYEVLRDELLEADYEYYEGGYDED